MGAETQKHEAQSRFGLVGEGIHGVLEAGISFVHLARLAGKDALSLVRGQEISETPRLIRHE